MRFREEERERQRRSRAKRGLTRPSARAGPQRAEETEVGHGPGDTSNSSISRMDFAFLWDKLGDELQKLSRARSEREVHEIAEEIWHFMGPQGVNSTPGHGPRAFSMPP